MIPLTLGKIARIVKGQVLHATGEELVTAPAFIDTREILSGGLFVALLGEHVDGHDFVGDAAQRGAVAALVTRDVGHPSVLVTDAVNALQLLATHVRKSLSQLKVIGITGSQGKTTTKDLLFAILSSVAPTIAPPGNLNNELGVPLTLLRCSEETQFCVAEMGARHEGEIATLANIAQVDVGAVLNIGTAHVGEFGSDSALASAKGELVASLKPDGIAVLGSYDVATKNLAVLAKCRVTTFGDTAEAIVQGKHVSLVDGKAKFTLAVGDRSHVVQLNYYGRHQVANALAAAAIATELGIELSTIARALSMAVPVSRWRMEVSTRTRDGVTVINDAYNANPESTAAAIELLTEWAQADRRPSWAVLGQMRELGASSDQAHQLIGRLVAQRGINHLLVIGSGASEILNGARGMAIADATSVADLASARRYLQEHIEPNALVLVKASRAEGLEILAHQLAGDQA
jgi:UDP-N-acetylmuramoyl-tripeptide--D-alanyl-D-alanine ligase